MALRSRRELPDATGTGVFAAAGRAGSRPAGATMVRVTRTVPLDGTCVVVVAVPSCGATAVTVAVPAGTPVRLHCPVRPVVQVGG